MEHIPINFEHEGKNYSGYFNKVAGAGSSSVWHLYDHNNYFLGKLRYTDHWIFDGKKFTELANFFGDYVIAWYQ